MEYIPQIFVLDYKNEQSLLVFDPMHVYESITKDPLHVLSREMAYKKLSKLKYKLIDTKYVFDMNTIGDIHRKLINIVKTDRIFLYSLEYNIDVVHKIVFNPKLNARKLENMKTIASDIRISQIVHNVYNGFIWYVMLDPPESFDPLLVYVNELVETEYDIYEMQYLTKLPTMPPISYSVDKNNTEYLYISIKYISDIDMIKLYELAPNPLYMIRKHNGLYFSITGDLVIPSIEYNTLVEEYNIEADSIIIVCKQMIITNSDIIYNPLAVEDLSSFLSSSNIEMLQSFNMNPITYTLDNNIQFSVKNINEELNDYKHFLTRTKSYNMYESVYNGFRLLVSKSKFTMLQYKQSVIEQSFVSHILKYLYYASLSQGSNELESKLSNIKNLYWSKICQNSGTELRKPLELKSLDSSYKKVNHYWQGPKDEDLAILINNKYFVCKDKTYRHLGFLSKLYESFGICRPCCFKKPMVTKAIFTKCTNPEIEYEKEAKLVYNDLYILNSRLYVQPGKLSMLSDKLDKFLNFVFMKNRLSLKSNRLHETEGYFLVNSNKVEYGKHHDIKNLVVLNEDATCDFLNIDHTEAHIDLRTFRKGFLYSIDYIRKSATKDLITNILTREIIINLLNVCFIKYRGFLQYDSDILMILGNRTKAEEEYKLVTLSKSKYTLLPQYRTLVEIPKVWINTHSKPLSKERPKEYYTIMTKDFVGDRNILTSFNLVKQYYKVVFESLIRFAEVDEYVIDAINVFTLHDQLFEVNDCILLLNRLNQWYFTDIKLQVVESTSFLSNPNTIYIHNKVFV